MQELVADLAEGECYKIDYAETAPKDGHKYGSKYVNRARTWQVADGPNTWPDKEPYAGGGGNSYSSGGNVSKNDYDPEIVKRQTAANCAGNIYASQKRGLDIYLDEFAVTFPVLAEVVLKFVDSKGDVGVKADGGSGQSTDEFENTF